MKLSKICFWIISFLPLFASGQTWKIIPNNTFGITQQYQKILVDKWGKHHIFIGFRRGNSTVGKNNPMVYYQVESKKLQVFDLLDGVLDPPKYDSAMDIFWGCNRQPLLIWKLKMGSDSAKIDFITTNENRVLDNMSFNWRKERDGWYYGTTTPKGRFFRFNPENGKIENLGQAEMLNGVKNVRRTSFYFALTPKGWAMNYRDDKNGGYFLYYQTKDGGKKYSVFLGKELTPSPILVSKAGNEVIAIRVKDTQKKVEWRIFNQDGQQIKDGSYRYPEDFVEMPAEIKNGKTNSIQEVNFINGQGLCKYIISGEEKYFSFHLELDLQKMNLVHHNPNWGWMGTSGKYQEIFFLDSTSESAKFSITNDQISAYALGGSDEIIIAGYPSKIGLFQGDSIQLLISKNSFPKYFVSLVEKKPFLYFLGKNDRDRTGYEVWRYNEVSKVLDQPWKFQLDSIFMLQNGESLGLNQGKLVLFNKSKKEDQLIAFELLNNQINPLVLPQFSCQMKGDFPFAIHSETGSFCLWCADSLWIGKLGFSETNKVIPLGIFSEGKNYPNKSVMAFIDANRILVSGWNKTKKRGELRTISLKKQKVSSIKVDWENPRPFALNKSKQALFFGGSINQNKNFELLTLPEK